MINKLTNNVGKQSSHILKAEKLIRNVLEIR